MPSIDEQFVEFIVKSLVGKPDEVQIERTIDEKGVLLELTVDPEDLGRVIGKRGATAQSVRTLLRALGTKNDARYNLKIVDNGVGGHRHDDSGAPAPVQHDDNSAGSASVADDYDQPQSSALADLKDEDDDADVAVVSDKEESLAERTRKELNDLDDLDV